MGEKDEVKKRMLRDMLTPPRWGGRHTDARNLRKGLPSYISSTKQGQKLVDDVIKELINDCWILAKKSTGQVHVSLNPRMKKEIMEYVSKQQKQ